MSYEFTEHLFSYGTLQRQQVQLSTFGRPLEGLPDALIGYRIAFIPIEDQEVVASIGDTHYKNVVYSGVDADVVEGTVFKVAQSELEMADKYEADANYKRELVTLKSGTKAWVYLGKSTSTD